MNIARNWFECEWNVCCEPGIFSIGIKSSNNKMIQSNSPFMRSIATVWNAVFILNSIRFFSNFFCQVMIYRDVCVEKIRSAYGVRQPVSKNCDIFVSVYIVNIRSYISVRFRISTTTNINRSRCISRAIIIWTNFSVYFNSVDRQNKSYNVSSRQPDRCPPVL